MSRTSRRFARTLKALAPVLVVLVAALAVAGVAGAATLGDATTSADPWIASDQADYTPGSTVHLTGGNWQPGETVSIFTNDSIGNTWSQTDKVTADANGGIVDDVTLPNSFIANYTVTATAPSGSATTTFTDGNASSVSGIITDSVTHAPIFGAAVTCTAAGGCNGTITTTTDSSGNYAFNGMNKLTFASNAPATLTLSVSAGGYTSGAITLNIPSNGASLSGQNAALVPAVESTAISAVSGAGTYAGTATLTATLKAGTTALSGKTISFKLNGTSVGTANTDDGGVASLGGVSLSGFDAGTASGAVTASFAGDSSLTSSNGAGDLTVAPASSATVVTCPASVVYDGSAKTPCTVSVTGAGGLGLAPDAVYANNTNAGTATASYTYAGDANHDGSSDSETFTINKAPSTVAVTCPSAGQTYTGSALTPCTAKATGAGLGDGVDLTGSIVYENNLNVGTANASVNWDGDANHDGSSDSETFTIVKAPSTVAVTCPSAGQTYTGSALTPCTAKATGAGLGDGVDLTSSIVYDHNVDVGTANASASWGGDSNHTGDSGTGSFSIVKAPSATVVTCPASVVYDGSAKTPCTVSVTGAGGLGLAPDAVYANNTNAGTATASYTYAGDANLN